MTTPPLLEVGTGFKLPDSIDLSILDDIPVMVHKYGDEQPPKDVFRWMSYKNEGNVNGNIDFARDCGKFFPEVAEYVVWYLSELFDMKFSKEYVNFMRTSGDIVRHTDEVRRSCINIGIKNTDSAITRFYEETTALDFRVKQGSVYLLDVSKPHSVHSDDNSTRLLITIGFEKTFLQIYDKIKRQ